MKKSAIGIILHVGGAIGFAVYVWSPDFDKGGLYRIVGSASFFALCIGYFILNAPTKEKPLSKTAQQAVRYFTLIVGLIVFIASFFIH